jgi:8-oxo-dGTP pyrophosphatase MutT (NUDIX family)
MTPVVPIRDAATVMLVRDGVAGVEVFLMRRHLRSVFSAGAHVFPGGAVDDHDRTVEGADPFVVAAIRECFEEAGALLARDGDGAMVDLRDPMVAERFAAHRLAVHAGERTLVDVCREEDLRPAFDALHFVSRWITPPGAPRRYDTRFFVAAAPADQAYLHDDTELIDSAWFRPQDALDQFRAGGLELILPTERSLETLAQHDSVAAVLSSVA